MCIRDRASGLPEHWPKNFFVNFGPFPDVGKKATKNDLKIDRDPRQNDKRFKIRPLKMSPGLFQKVGKSFFLNPGWSILWFLFATIFLNIHLYDLLDVLDLVDELHLCHARVVLEPAD